MFSASPIVTASSEISTVGQPPQAGQSVTLIASIASSPPFDLMIQIKVELKVKGAEQ
jgi:hypothetical protein